MQHVLARKFIRDNFFQKASNSRMRRRFETSFEQFCQPRGGGEDASHQHSFRLRGRRSVTRLCCAYKSFTKLLWVLEILVRKKKHTNTHTENTTSSSKNQHSVCNKKYFQRVSTSITNDDRGSERWETVKKWNVHVVSLLRELKTPRCAGQIPTARCRSRAPSNPW